MPRILSHLIIDIALTAAESGLLVFKLIEGEFAHTGAYVDILMDDMAYASYATAKIKSKHMTFNEGKKESRHLLITCY